MAVGYVKAGYTGIASLDGVKWRVSSGDISLKQGVIAEDLISGHWNKMAARAEPITVGGDLSGPLTEAISDKLLALVTRDQTCGGLTAKTIGFAHYCQQNGISFSGYANSVNLSVSAGDVANLSVSLLGAGAPETFSSSVPNTTVDQLITWDQCSISMGGITNCVSQFDITFNQNIQTLFCIPATAGTSDLYPYDLLPGMTDISATVTYYNHVGDDFGVTTNANFVTGAHTLTFTFGNFTGTIVGNIHRPSYPLSTGAATTTVIFTAVGDQSGVF